MTMTARTMPHARTGKEEGGSDRGWNFFSGWVLKVNRKMVADIQSEQENGSRHSNSFFLKIYQYGPILVLPNIISDSYLIQIHIPSLYDADYPSLFQP